jgi:hypothetical protein
MSTAYFQPLADLWEENGRTSERLVDTNYALLQLVMWLKSSGAQQQGFSDSLLAFAEASIEAQGGEEWWNRQYDDRIYCSRCGERWLKSNMFHCTQCTSSLCMSCAPFTTAPNGNTLHDCGGEMAEFRAAS